VFKSIIAIALGSSLGALLRWTLSVNFNLRFTAIPPGTLLANLIGGYVVGLAIAFFSSASSIAPEWRLFIITGFCGGLTTFSTFSAEVVTLLQEGRMIWAVAAIGAHLSGSLLMTVAGMQTWQWIQARS
jgi:CrcB protein